jgi:hypothetical protein
MHLAELAKALRSDSDRNLLAQMNADEGCPKCDAAKAEASDGAARAPGGKGLPDADGELGRARTIHVGPEKPANASLFMECHLAKRGGIAKLVRFLVMGRKAL